MTVDTDQDIYVVIAEWDVAIEAQERMTEEEKAACPPEPIVFETNLNTATLEDAKKRKERFNERYGDCRIAKLQFIGE